MLSNVVLTTSLGGMEALCHQSLFLQRTQRTLRERTQRGTDMYQCHAVSHRARTQTSSVLVNQFSGVL